MKEMTILFCTECGKKLRESAKYCDKCGMHVDATQEFEHSHSKLVGYWLGISSTNPLEYQHEMEAITQYKADGTGIVYYTDEELITKGNGIIYYQEVFTWRADGPSSFIVNFVVDGILTSGKVSYTVTKKKKEVVLTTISDELTETNRKLPKGFEITIDDSKKLPKIGGFWGKVAGEVVVGIVKRLLSD